MNFNDCIKKGNIIETGEKDFNKAKELLELAEHKLSFWKEIEGKAQKYPSLFIEGHYEIIKELIVGAFFGFFLTLILIGLALFLMEIGKEEGEKKKGGEIK